MKHLTNAVLIIVLVLSRAHTAENVSNTAVQNLVAKLTDQDFDVREKAEAALSALSKDAIPILEKQLSSRDLEVRTRVLRVLSTIEFAEGSRLESEWLRQSGPLFGCKNFGSEASRSEFLGREVAKNQVDEQTSNPTLEWLVRNQEPDGHWDSKKFGAETDADIEQTAFAMLAFLEYGHTDKVGGYKDNLRLAGEWLCKQQNADGAIFRAGQPDGITHAVAGIALSELAGFNPQSALKPFAQRAIEYSTEKHQAVLNGKRSGFGRSPMSDKPDLLTTTFFTIQLRAAKIAALKVNYESFEGLIQFLESVQGRDGRTFRFAANQFPSPKATVLGLLCKLFLGCKTAEMQPTAEQLINFVKQNSQSDERDVLSNYAAFVAFYYFGGSRWNGRTGLWKELADVALPKILDSRCNSGDGSGTWEPKGFWRGSGRVFTTALNVICLGLY